MLKQTTVTLTTPIKMGDKEIATLDIKEPTLAQMVTVQGYVGFEQSQRLLATVTGIPFPTMGSMSFTDLKVCVAILDDFMGETTGAN